MEERERKRSDFAESKSEKSCRERETARETGNPAGKTPAFQRKRERERRE